MDWKFLKDLLFASMLPAGTDVERVFPEYAAAAKAEREAAERRVFACVNACAGIPTEELEAGALAEVLRAAEEVASHAAECVPEVDQDALRAALRSIGRLP